MNIINARIVAKQRNLALFLGYVSEFLKKGNYFRKEFIFLQPETPRHVMSFFKENKLENRKILSLTEKLVVIRSTEISRFTSKRK